MSASDADQEYIYSTASDPDQEYIYTYDPDQEYIHFMESDTLRFTCYILSDESNIPFYSTSRVKENMIKNNEQCIDLTYIDFPI